MNLKYIKVALNIIKCINMIYKNYDKIVLLPRHTSYKGIVYRTPMYEEEWKYYTKHLKLNKKLKIVKLSKNYVEIEDA